MRRLAREGGNPELLVLLHDEPEIEDAVGERLIESLTQGLGHGEYENKHVCTHVSVTFDLS